MISRITTPSTMTPLFSEYSASFNNANGEKIYLSVRFKVRLIVYLSYKEMWITDYVVSKTVCSDLTKLGEVYHRTDSEIYR